MNLTKQKCVPCKGGIPPFTKKQTQKHLKELKTNWKVLDNKKLRQEFKFKTFKSAIAFVNKVADIAEQTGHHPDIYIYYNKVVTELYTHAIDGLHLNDFIIAAKIEKLL